MKDKKSTKQISKKKVGKKAKGRMFLAFLFFGVIISGLSYKFFDNISKINKMKEEKHELQERLSSLKDEEKSLNIDIQKLQDPAYVARYAREKYLYSKDGELIIRITE